LALSGVLTKLVDRFLYGSENLLIYLCAMNLYDTSQSTEST
jgi:hypothetical protein